MDPTLETGPPSEKSVEPPLEPKIYPFAPMREDSMWYMNPEEIVR